MTTTEQNHAIDNAKTWLETIEDLCRRMRSLDPDEVEAANDEVQDSALAVEVRGGWRSPGQDRHPEEYRICLTTGGPGLQITGDLDGNQYPDSAVLLWQDWGTPWTALELGPEQRAAVLTFARCFYFGG